MVHFRLLALCPLALAFCPVQRIQPLRSVSRVALTPRVSGLKSSSTDDVCVDEICVTPPPESLPDGWWVRG